MVDNQTAETPQKAVVDFEGTGGEPQFERILIKEGEHTGPISRLETQEFEKYDKKGKEIKMILFFKSEKENKEVPCFVKPKIQKAYKSGVSNSKLYDILVTANLLETAKQNQEQLTTVQGQIKFLQDNLIGKRARFSAKTANKNDPAKEKYSRVDSIYEFLGEDPTTKDATPTPTQ